MSTVTDLSNARLFRKKGWPLNMPTEDATFSPQAEKKINKAYDACGAFRKRIDAFGKNPSHSSFRAMQRAHDKLAFLIRQAACVPVWRRDDDGGSTMTNVEDVAAAAFIGQLAMCAEGWQRLFDQADEAANAGEPFTMTHEMFAVLWPFNGKRLSDAE